MTSLLQLGPCRLCQHNSKIRFLYFFIFLFLFFFIFYFFFGGGGGGGGGDPLVSFVPP